MWFLAGTKVGNYIYFSEWRTNGLYKLDLFSGEYEFVTYFLEEDGNRELHNFAFQYDDKIWFIPHKAEKIAVYDITEDVISYLELPDDGEIVYLEDNVRTFRFYCIRKDEFCYLIPVGYNQLLKLDMKNSEIHEISMKDVCAMLGEKVVWSRASLINEMIILFSRVGDKEIRIDCANDSIEKCSAVYGEKVYIKAVSYKENKIYVPSCLKDGLLIEDSHGGEIKNIPLKKYIGEEDLYLECEVLNNRLYIFPIVGEKIVICNLDDFSIETICISEKYWNSNHAVPWLFHRCILADQTLYASSGKGDCLLIVDPSHNLRLLECKENVGVFYKKSREIYNNHKKDKFFEIPKGVVSYEMRYPLEALLNSTMQQTVCEEEKISCGQKIFNACKDV